MGVSRWTIYRNVVQGIIPAKRLSQRTTLIRKKDIETLFDVIEPYEVLVTGERKLIDEWYTIDEITFTPASDKKNYQCRGHTNKESRNTYLNSQKQDRYVFQEERL